MPSGEPRLMMEDASIVERLPAELRDLTLSYCDSSAILNLCLASKAHLCICVASLYKSIDLSIHNDEKWRVHQNYNTGYKDVHVPPDHPKCDLKEETITYRQTQLLELLNSQPDLGLQTRVLRWTLAVADRSLYQPFNSRECDECPPQDGFNFGTDELWRTFMCFSRLTEVDLAFMTGSREMCAPPSLLFTTVTSLSLTGLVSCTLLSTIMSSVQPSTLRHLKFNNLQTFAEETRDLDHMSDQTIDAHRRAQAGPAFGFLRDWTGQCSVLRSFQYISTAQFCHFPRRSRLIRDRETQIQNENNHYAEIGYFIDSVRSTLREFLFEHGPDFHYFEPDFRSSVLGLDRHSPLPMDVCFNSYIFPILISEWPHLKSMIVKGVSHWKRIDPWADEATPEDHQWLHNKTTEFRRVVLALMDAAPEGCEVVVEDEASRPLYRIQDDRSVTGKGRLNHDLLIRTTT